MDPNAVRIDEARLVHDNLDGEVLVIRNDTGTYYSLAGTAAEVWSFIDAGAPLDTTVATLAERHAADVDAVDADVRALVDRLAAEGLVIVGEAGPTKPLPEPSATGAWVAPTVEVFEDMQDLLLFDPIHEVGPEGWPQVADRPAE